MSIRIYEGVQEAYTFLELLTGRQEASDRATADLVQEMIDDIRQNGDSAVEKYSAKFDGSQGPIQALGIEELEAAKKRLDPELVAALERAAEKIRIFHEAEKTQGFILTQPGGSMMGQRVLPLEKVGLYVPGGTAAYPSSVLMNAIPAQIAGVEQIVMVTPPGVNGMPADVILAAARIAGVDVCYPVGGAQAVAALAYGTESIPAVDKIVGPGNTYVAWAKRLVYGQVAIDMIAGPSEILIIADESARAEYLAADLLSQAEHDPLAGAVLLTDDPSLAQATAQEIKSQISLLPRRETAEEALRNYGGIVVFDELAQAVEFSNAMAPEHLEIQTKAPWEVLTQIKHAGSVFLGPWTPEAVGDYYAGANHVLPTGGTARFSSPLGVADFTKRMAYTSYSRADLLAASKDIMTIAKAEGLEAHSRSVEVRLHDD